MAKKVRKIRRFIFSAQVSIKAENEDDAQINQFTLNEKLVAHYKSISEASRQTGIMRTCISRVCNGARDTAGNYKWEKDK